MAFLAILILFCHLSMARNSFFLSGVDVKIGDNVSEGSFSKETKSELTSAQIVDLQLDFNCCLYLIAAKASSKFEPLFFHSPTCFLNLKKLLLVYCSLLIFPLKNCLREFSIGVSD